MVDFASPEWIAELDAALRSIEASGPPLRVRYRFLPDEPTGQERGYELVFGEGVRAEAVSTIEPTVTITQPLAVARQIAAGQIGAPRATLDGSVEIAGRVTELVAWRTTLAAVERGSAELRARTVWR